MAGSPSLIAQEQKAAAATEVAKVNINTADAQTLAANLKGVGESRAMEIVRYREAYGPFASADELTEVKGIGPSTLEMNRDAITLE
ncbi:MAG: ComEA family DNA-binding protein [Halioglobus sp.]